MIYDLLERCLCFDAVSQDGSSLVLLLSSEKHEVTSVCCNSTNRHLTPGKFVNSIPFCTVK